MSLEIYKATDSEDGEVTVFAIDTEREIGALFPTITPVEDIAACWEIGIQLSLLITRPISELCARMGDDKELLIDTGEVS